MRVMRASRLAVLLRLGIVAMLLVYLFAGASFALPSAPSCARCNKISKIPSVQPGAACLLSSRGHHCHGDLEHTAGKTARYLLLQAATPYSPSLSLIFGAKLPTGCTNVTNDAGEKTELTLQPGNGSWDGILGLSIAQNFSAITLRREVALASVFATALLRFPVGVGKFGYEPGFVSLYPSSLSTVRCDFVSYRGLVSGLAP